MTTHAHTSLIKRATLAFATLAAVMVLASPAAFADNGRHDNRYRYNDGPYRYDTHRYTHTHQYNWNNAYRNYHYAPQPYKIGRPLPYFVKCEPVSRHALGRLRPAPRGTRYVQVGPDVLLISQGSKMVLWSVRVF
ncbi:MAG TPA: hypothetical protein PKI93_05410 [Alphaproteobacteria bacterium]|nr:hypothetical protein [Alphaproteobacteria bacterium]